MFVQKNIKAIGPDYMVDVPPLSKPIEELTEEEAAEYNAWFITTIPKRVDYLKDICCESLRISTKKINYSPDSLFYVWKWFNSAASFDYEKQSERIFSLYSEYALRDIGIYLGQLFVVNFSNLTWGYYTTPRNDFFVNMPIIQGFIDNRFGKQFKPTFQPVHMVGVQAAKILNRKAKYRDLLDLYYYWVQFIPKIL